MGQSTSSEHPTYYDLVLYRVDNNADSVPPEIIARIEMQKARVVTNYKVYTQYSGKDDGEIRVLVRVGVSQGPASQTSSSLSSALGPSAASCDHVSHLDRVVLVADLDEVVDRITESARLT
nr:hypothetical protein CFP56_53296 [Quercus suber]